jgi:2-methylcitrate dehydratase PrpD
MTHTFAATRSDVMTASELIARSRDVADRVPAATARGAQGPASLIGVAAGVPAEFAAYHNALCSTVLQMDEGHRGSRTHPATHVVPAALAVAEEVDCSGQDLLRAVILGYEVTARLGLFLGKLPPGHHSHGTRPAFGAAVAAASLLGASDRQLAQVLDAMSSLRLVPDARTANAGATVHLTFAATGALHGIRTARAVLAGATTLPGAFDEYVAASRHDGYDDWASDEPQISANYFKLHAACAFSHTVLDAIRDAVQAAGLPDGGLPAEDLALIDTINVRTFSVAASLSATRPDNDLAARFSIPFNVARLLRFGTVGSGILTPDELGDPATLELAAKVRLGADAALDREFPAVLPATVHIAMSDGRRLEAARDRPRGDEHSDETDVAWQHKIESLVGHHADELLGFREKSPTGWSARALGTLLRTKVTGQLTFLNR